MWGYNISWLAHMGIRGGRGVCTILQRSVEDMLATTCVCIASILSQYPRPIGFVPWMYIFLGGKHRLGQLVQTNKDGFNFHSSSKRGGTHVEPKTH